MIKSQKSHEEVIRKSLESHEKVFLSFSFCTVADMSKLRSNIQTNGHRDSIKESAKGRFFENVSAKSETGLA